MKLKFLVLSCVLFSAAASAVFSQTKTSMDYLGEASRYYMEGDIKKRSPNIKRRSSSKRRIVIKERALARDGR